VQRLSTGNEAAARAGATLVLLGKTGEKHPGRGFGRAGWPTAIYCPLRF